MMCLMQAGTLQIINIAALGILGAASVLAQDPRVPIENESVRVLKVLEEPRHKTKLHEHKLNRVMIYLDAGKQTIDYEGGKKTVLNFKAAQVLWSPLAGMHVAEVVSDNNVGIVEVELKKPAPSTKPVMSKLDPLKVDPKHYKVEFDNDQVRVVRVKIGPHESTPIHEHTMNRVVTYITDQDFKITSSDGKVTNTQHKAGEVSWGMPGTHKEENLSDKPFEIIMVELK